MNSALAGKLDATGKEAAVGFGVDSLLDGLMYTVRNLGRAITSIDSHRQARPANNVGMQRREINYLPILDGDKMRALGAVFSDMTALKIAGKHDMRMLVKDLAVMDMPKSPVVVSLGE
jgi:hypothetical protein